MQTNVYPVGVLDDGSPTHYRAKIVEVHCESRDVPGHFSSRSAAQEAADRMLREMQRRRIRLRDISYSQRGWLPEDYVA